ncbi:MAG: hypothetical protein EON60_02145 [Alphaproteobacteria bacterium]|nr:MAG: hypothetical protein EON60_02145 [Alphaproteobacteria bacterium]
MAHTLTPLHRLAKRLHPHLRGFMAEKLALIVYMAHGWLPVYSHRRQLAQTDLTLARGTTLILVEVKYRTSQGRGHLAVRPEQKQRLERQMRLLAGKYPGYSLRIELFLVFPHKPFWQRISHPYTP